MKKCITWQESGQLISIATSWVLIHCTIKAFQNHPPGCLIYNHNIQIRQALLSCISTTICVTSWLYASGSCVNSIWFKWCTSSVIIFTFDKALPDPKRLFSAEVLGMPGICSASRSSEVCRESIETWQRVVPVVGGCPESELRSTWANGLRFGRQPCI